MRAAAARADRTQPNAREAARLAVERLGCEIVPIPRGRKGPAIEDWPNKTLLVDDIEPAGNYGIKTSARLADADKEIREVIEAGEYFLPPTKLRHGRLSNRNSHGWYTTDAESLPSPTPTQPGRVATARS